MLAIAVLATSTAPPRRNRPVRDASVFMTPDRATIRSATSWLRGRLRASEAVLILLAVAIGGAA
ncbi:MAG: hypothetical protein EOP67_24015, partial [Sphingomonas sp.]